MRTVTDTLNNSALKRGAAAGKAGAGKLTGSAAGFKPLGLILLVLALLIGVALLGVLLFARKKRKQPPAVPETPGSRTTLILLTLSSAILLGLAGWAVYDHRQQRRIAIGASARTMESYALAQALKTVTERHYPRLKIAILEIENAPELLEKGIVQLATAPSDTPMGPHARSVAALTRQSLLLARSDVEAKVVYALTQVLIERGQELADALPAAKAALRPLAANVQPPGEQAKSDVPLHPGAAAFYERDKIRLMFRYPTITALTFAGLVLLALWAWELIRRARRKRQAERERQERRFAGLAGRAPWSFSQILLESAGEASPPS